MAPNLKINLKDKVEDGEMDLSMCDLQDVPVKEIAVYKKVYSLDLSNNHLTQLPKTFPTLTNLIKLDLSKNKIKTLPDNFGELVKLKHLDLYKNELQHLPLSFSNLKSLKWLDLKDNPLVGPIKEAAGPCLDSKQCLKCAVGIVLFYTQLKEKVEEERETREKQRQKDKQANDAATAQKLKQEKKNKKKEKAKNNEINNQKSEIQESRKQQTQSNVNETKARKGFNLLPCIFTLLFFICTGLFILTSINYEKTIFIENLVIDYWKICMQKSPPFIQEFGNKTGSFVQITHQRLGELIFEFGKYEYVEYVVNKLKYFYDSVISGNK